MYVDKDSILREQDIILTDYEEWRYQNNILGYWEDPKYRGWDKAFFDVVIDGNKEIPIPASRVQNS